jgi:hypothetical protein
MILLAVTGLVLWLCLSLLAMPSDAFTELSHSWNSVADKTWTSAKPIERVGAWKVEPVRVTSSMFRTRVVRVIDAFGDIELYRFSFLQLRQAHCGLAYLCDLFHAWWKREIHGRFGHLRIAVPIREFIEEWITRFLLRDDFRHVEEKRVHLLCGHVADVLDRNLHVSGSQRVGISAASQWHEQFWGPSVNYERGMLDVQNVIGPPCLDHRDCDIGDEIAYATNCNKTRESQFNLSSSTQTLPVTIEAVFFLLAGFAGGWLGFTSFFACLFFDSSGTRIGGSLALVI